MFDPKTNKFPYPEDTDKHYLVVKKNDGTVFDKDYPYVDKSFGFRLKYNLTRILLYIVVVRRCFMGVKWINKGELEGTAIMFPNYLLTNRQFFDKFDNKWGESEQETNNSKGKFADNAKTLTDRMYAGALFWGGAEWAWQENKHFLYDEIDK